VFVYLFDMLTKDFVVDGEGDDVAIVDVVFTKVVARPDALDSDDPVAVLGKALGVDRDIRLAVDFGRNLEVRAVLVFAEPSFAVGEPVMR
jgi:hypothetical protein